MNVDVFDSPRVPRSHVSPDLAFVFMLPMSGELDLIFIFGKFGWRK